MGALLAPIGFGFGILADWLHQKSLRDAFPGWRFVDQRAPWYIPALVITFYVGLIFAVSAILSFLSDYVRQKRTDVRHR